MKNVLTIRTRQTPKKDNFFCNVRLFPSAIRVVLIVVHCIIFLDFVFYFGFGCSAFCGGALW